jgi:SSS family solute:Na+ symporter
MIGGLHWIDGVIIAAYACGMLAVGAYYRFRQKNSDEYFVGNRAMSPFLIGVSMYATLFSTISYLSTPGEIINHGPVVLAGSLSIPVVYFVVGYLMIPVYMQHRVTSAYELLETRLGLRARLVGATLFVLLRLMWMSTLIFFASKAMLTMLELDEKWLPVVTFVTGSVAIGYSSIGGLRAVVITDLFQFLLLFGGAVLVIATVTHRLGGFDWIPTQWNDTWDTQPLFGLPTVRVTVFGSLSFGTIWWICTAGSDQTAIQRFMATGDAKAARRSFLFNSIAGIAVSVVLALVGFSLLAYYQADSQRLAAGMTIADNADLLFPYFISHHLPAGLSGLVVSGMFAAAMSSIDSGINSITAVVMTDFVERFRTNPLGEKLRTRSSRLLALAIGLLVVTASSFMQHVPGNFLEISQRTVGLFVTPLFTLFFLGLFVKASTEPAAIFGALVSLLTAASVAYWEPLTGLPMISFQWILPFSLIAGIVAGSLFSLLSMER